jgi:hypothetical protein
VDFEEALLKFGFHPATGRTPKGVQVLAAEPNPFLTYTVQAFDDGSGRSWASRSRPVRASNLAEP